MCSVAGHAAAPLSDSEITARALAGSDAACVKVLELFCAMLGTVAGNVAITLGAGGGVYLIGGILPRFADAFAGSGFRARFESKGRFTDYMKAIPTFLVTHENPAMLGLAELP